MPDPSRLFVLSDDDLFVLKRIIDEHRKFRINERPIRFAEGQKSTELMLAMTPPGGIPHADPSTNKVYAALCEMYREEVVLDAGGNVVEDEKEIVPITLPDGSPYEEWVFHFDPEDDIPSEKLIVTSLTRFGTRFALWESCNEWS